MICHFLLSLNFLAAPKTPVSSLPWSPAVFRHIFHVRSQYVQASYFLESYTVEILVVLSIRVCCVAPKEQLTQAWGSATLKLLFSLQLWALSVGFV